MVKVHSVFFFFGLLFFLRELWSIWIGGSRKVEQRLDKRLTNFSGKA